MSSTRDLSLLATLNRFYEAETAYLLAAEPDFSGIAATLDPECVIYQPASLPYGGEWRGHAGFEAWMKAFASHWASLEARDPEFFPFHNVVISKSHVYAKSRITRHDADWPLLQLFRFRGSLIVELRPFHWDTAAILSAMHQGTT